MCLFCKILEHHKHLSDGLEFKGRIFFFFFSGPVRLIFHYQVRSAQDFKIKQRELTEHHRLQNHHNLGAFPGCAH